MRVMPPVAAIVAVCRNKCFRDRAQIVFQKFLTWQLCFVLRLRYITIWSNIVILWWRGK